MLYLSRGLTFNLDEWFLVAERRGPGAPSLLAPHNDHLSIVPLVAFLSLVRIAGLDAQPVMMLPLIALQLGIGVLLFATARSRVGPGVAVGVAALAMVAGLAFENFLVPGQIGQLSSIAAGVAAFLLLDRSRTRRTDLGVAALLAVALASSGLGIAVLAGVTAELVLRPEGRRRLWVVAVAFVPYLAWYAVYGSSNARFDDLVAIARWGEQAAAHGAGVILGQRLQGEGRLLLAGGLALVAWRAWRGPAVARPRIAGLLVLLGCFYALTAISRHGLAPPSSSRYLTVGLVFGLLLLVEAARGTRLRERRWAPAAVLVLAGLAFAQDHHLGFQEGRTSYLERTQRARGALGAVALLGPARVAEGLEFAPDSAPLLRAGPWFAARAALRGDPAYAPAELPGAPPIGRAGADDALVRAGALRVRPVATDEATAAGSPRPPSGRTASAGSAPCRPVPADRPVAVHAAGLRIRAGAVPVAIRVRRFAADWSPVAPPPVAPRRTMLLRAAPDAAPARYVVALEGAAAACVPG